MLLVVTRVYIFLCRSIFRWYGDEFELSQKIIDEHTINKEFDLLCNHRNRSSFFGLSKSFAVAVYTRENSWSATRRCDFDTVRGVKTTESPYDVSSHERESSEAYIRRTFGADATIRTAFKRFFSTTAVTQKQVEKNKKIRSVAATIEYIDRNQRVVPLSPWIYL